MTADSDVAVPEKVGPRMRYSRPSCADGHHAFRRSTRSSAASNARSLRPQVGVSPTSSTTIAGTVAGSPGGR